MLDYDDEAAHYDRTRGGRPRALAAASAISGLLPARASIVLDLGGGTGAVATELTTPERTVLVADASVGMLRLAAKRVDGRCAQVDATVMPFRDASVDAVVCVWLFHLLTESDVAAIVAATARVLRSGGVLVTTVDKRDASPSTDIATALAPLRPYRSTATDATATIDALTARHGLRRTGTATFTGVGQGWTPLGIIDDVDGRYSAAPDSMRSAVIRALSGLPDPERPRADPVYTLVRYTKDV
ncbi:class I SAM-dependent methyltransferase [Stackebrandtia soli]|uniref:class I SAM-dependent methyltransferase n=1 Tax=Stackebrandtia soli TaxID=1892856 RepID=UPI0039ED22D0